MLSRLGLQSGQSVLEPSAGDGAFVKALLETGLGLNVCCVDKDPEAVDRLTGKFGDAVHVINADTILDMLDSTDGLLAKRGLPLRFDRIVEGFQSRGDYYRTLTLESICERILTREEMTTGIVAGPSWVPIVKGGAHRFYQPDMWVVDWSNAAIAYYKGDAKARFQNSDFYFREGIGVPMVTSTKINAFLLGRRVFDQSVVGIFPRRREWLFPLLSAAEFAALRLKPTRGRVKLKRSARGRYDGGACRFVS